jgi:hypothetical protein
MLLSQVSELKTELVRRGSPKNIMNDVTSKLTEIKNTVTSMKDGTSLGQTHGAIHISFPQALCSSRANVPCLTCGHTLRMLVSLHAIALFLFATCHDVCLRCHHVCLPAPRPFFFSMHGCHMRSLFGRICMHASVLHIHISAYTHIFARGYAHTHTHTHTHTRAHTHIHTHADSHTNTYSHTHTHTHTDGMLWSVDSESAALPAAYSHTNTYSHTHTHTHRRYAMEC